MMIMQEMYNIIMLFVFVIVSQQTNSQLNQSTE